MFKIAKADSGQLLPAHRHGAAPAGGARADAGGGVRGQGRVGYIIKRLYDFLSNSNGQTEIQGALPSLCQAFFIA